MGHHIIGKKPVENMSLGGKISKHDISNYAPYFKRVLSKMTQAQKHKYYLLLGCSALIISVCALNNPQYICRSTPTHVNIDHKSLTFVFIGLT